MDKKADNKIISTKQKVDYIDDKIDIEKKNLKKIDETHEEINELIKNMNKCVDLLSKSIKGTSARIKYDDIRNSNNLFYRKATAHLEEESLASKTKINKYESQKEEILSEERIRIKRGDQGANSSSQKRESV